LGQEQLIENKQGELGHEQIDKTKGNTSAAASQEGEVEKLPTS